MTTLTNISIYSILLPLLVGVIFFRKLSKDSRLVWGVVFAGTIPQLLKPVIDNTTSLDTIYNLYIVIEFVIISFLFRNKFYLKRLNAVFRISILVYVILSLPVIIFNGIQNRFLNEWICLNSLAYTTWILIFLLEQYNDQYVFKLTFNSSFFWFITGIFFYSLCTLLIFSFWRFIETSPKNISDKLKAIHEIFNTNLYLFFTVGFFTEIIHLKKGITKTRIKFNEPINL
ncbi:MAG: hypothetical protein ABIN04_10945 [Ginsengibacter sp.]